MTPLATIAGTAVMFACASAQEAPVTAAKDKAPQSGKKAQKPTAAKAKAAPDQAKEGDAKKEAAADEAEPKPLYNSLSIGYTTWNSSKNINAMNQSGYVRGGFGAELSILMPFEHERFYAFDYNGNPGSDFATQLVGEWGGSTKVDVHASEFSYFDPNFGTKDPSRNQSWDASIEHQIAPNFGIFASYQVADAEHHFPAPLEQPNYQTRTMALGSQKQFGSSTLGATYSETRFSDYSMNQPLTLTNRGEVRYIGNFGPRLSAQGTAAVSRIQQYGQKDSWIHDYALSGVYDLNDNTSVGGQMSQSVLDLNNVQNAYTRKRISSGFKVDQRLGGWGLGFGYQHREEERVRADHTYVDVPAWNSYDVKLNGRLTKGIRLGLKGTMDDLATAPQFLTDDPLILYWDRKALASAKLSSGNERTTGYLSYTYRYRRNGQRGLSINWQNVTLGGSMVFSPKLLGYAEFASDQYSSGSNTAVSKSLAGYFPSSETFVFGVDYTRNTRESFSLVLSSFYTQDQWGQQVALSYRLDLGKERNIQITYSPWLQRDRLYDVDSFDASILAVKVGIRF